MHPLISGCIKKLCLHIAVAPPLKCTCMRVVRASLLCAAVAPPRAAVAPPLPSLGSAVAPPLPSLGSAVAPPRATLQRSLQSLGLCAAVAPPLPIWFLGCVRPAARPVRLRRGAAKRRGPVRLRPQSCRVRMRPRLRPQSGRGRRMRPCGCGRKAAEAADVHAAGRPLCACGCGRVRVRCGRKPAREPNSAAP